MTKIKETEEQRSLQMIVRMIRHPSCSSVLLQMVICKKDGSADDHNQGDGGAGIVANYHPEDPACSIPLQMFVCKEDCPSDDQNQGEERGWLQMIIRMIRPPPCSSVPLQR